MPIMAGADNKGHLWKFNDVTSVKKFEKTLKMQEEKYHNIIANMNLGLMEVDQDGIIRNVNNNFCDISGYHKDDLIGKTSKEILMSNINRNIIEQKNKLNKYGIIDIFQIPIINKNGEERWWLVSDAPVYDEKGDLRGLIGIHLDISAQKHMEKELEVARQKAEESSKAKETFLANMSHEIRTPLNAIIGMMRELSREQLSPKQHTYLNNAETSAQHLLSLINNILDMSKIGAGEFQLEHHHFNLKSVIDDTVTIVSVNAREKLLDLKVNFSNKIATAFIGDATRIRQILINLVGNSIKFTEKGGITIDCNVGSSVGSTQMVQISIIDTGIGIEKNYLKSIFNKFTQEDKSTARRYGGTGLGMAITYELVHLMGGTIEVASEKGKGTRIDINLPLAIGDPQEIESEGGRDSFERLNKTRILLVEDNEMNRLVASNTLSQFEVNIVEAENGFEAIERLKQETFDIILMDLQMPVIDGLLATKIIREVLKINTPIIALTANAFTKELDLCLTAGINDYITKPYEESDFLRIVTRNLGKEMGSRLISKPKIKHTAASEQLYDLKTVHEISRGNKDFVKRMIQLFINEIPPSIEQMKKAYKDGEFTVLNNIAHRIKPGINNMGINSVKMEIRRIEELAVEDPSSDLIPLYLNKVEIALAKVIEQLHKEEV